MQRLIRFAFWAAVILAFTLAVVRHPPAIEVWDKAQHMAAFFVIALLGCAAYPRFPRFKLVFALVAFGAGIELVQMIPFVARDAELDDWLADIVAVLAAIAFVALVQRLVLARSD